MGLESRGNNRYYNTKRRVGRRVVSEYKAGGELGVLLWQADTQSKAQQDATRAAWKAERARIEAADELVDELATMAHALMVETLHAAGYHMHRRQWRKRRTPHD